MSLPIFTRAIKFTSLLVFVLISYLPTASADWAIDLSRRRQDMRKQELKAPTTSNKDEGFFQKLFSADAKANDIVILNTKDGFLPDTVRLMQGMKYRIHVVNVNQAEMNVSFILDAFSEHHSTYYGKIQTFSVEPKQEGVYSFQCPETASEGRVVVYESEKNVPVRFPASR